MRIVGVLLLLALFAACAQEPEQRPQAAPAQGLKKLRNPSVAQIQQLREAGAEIIVQEQDYVIVRTENVQQALDLQFEAMSESDLVQRLVHVMLPDSGRLQEVIDTGIDFWELRGDTVVARAFDIHIEQLTDAGFTVEVIAQNASAREEK